MVEIKTEKEYLINKKNNYTRLIIEVKNKKKINFIDGMMLNIYIKNLNQINAILNIKQE